MDKRSVQPATDLAQNIVLKQIVAEEHPRAYQAGTEIRDAHVSDQQVRGCVKRFLFDHRVDQSAVSQCPDHHDRYYAGDL